MNNAAVRVIVFVFAGIGALVVLSVLFAPVTRQSPQVVYVAAPAPVAVQPVVAEAPQVVYAPPREDVYVPPVIVERGPSRAATIGAIAAEVGVGIIMTRHRDRGYGGYSPYGRYPPPHRGGEIAIPRR